MITTCTVHLPHGIHLSCRVAGDAGRPLMLFLHGFPEGAFVWDDLLLHFARPENGGFRCVAPNLRGFEASSAPTGVAAYKPALLLQDLRALAAHEHPQGHIHTLVAHDWGGALAWGLANAQPNDVGRLVIINAPHPAAFARELSDNPAQQQASAYMHFLARPDAEALLAEDDYRRMWRFFTSMRAGADGFGWLTDSVRQRYRALWNHGLTGACNLYRVTPLKPPRPGHAHDLRPVSAEQAYIGCPTLVLWALDDTALLPGLLDGLDAWVPQLQVQEIPDATHWVVHERPREVIDHIQSFIARH